MNILITGVSGFIGSGLVDYLHEVNNISLIGHSRDSEKTKEKFKNRNIEMVPEVAAAILDGLEINCVIHLAGIAHDLSNQFKSEDYERVNFRGTVSIFEEFIKSRAEKFIFLSSIKAVADTASIPVTEDIAPNPLSDYGKSKLKAESHILNVKLPQNKKAYIFRPAMIHGKDNKGNLNLLYKYVKSGLPYVFGSYSNQRSFLTAENLNFLLLEFMRSEFPSGVYHLADDGALSTNELVSIISNGLGRKPRIWNIPTSLINSVSKAASLVGLPTERLKNKLTESLVVSNSKLKQTLVQPLPLDSRAGLMKTLKFFHD